MRNFVYYFSLVVIFLIPWGEFIKIPVLGTSSRITGALLGALWLAAVLWTGRIRRPSLFHGALIVFVLWNALSILWSVDPDSSLWRSWAYVRMFLLTLILWDLYTSTERIRAGLQAFVLGAYLPALSTINNFFTGVERSWGRYSSTGSNANTTAIIIALAMPVAWHLATSQPPRRWARALRILNYSFLPAAALGMTLTGTRFAVVMSVPTLIFCVTTVGRLGRLTWATRVLVLVFLVLSVFYVTSVLPEASVERLSTIPEEALHGDLNKRRLFWDEGIRVWFDCPLAGVGAGAFKRAIPSRRSAHNSFIAVLVELGLVGLVMFGIVLAIVMLSVWRQPFTDRYFWLTISVVWLLGNLPLTYAHTRATWLLFSLAVASSALHTTYTSREHFPGMSERAVNVS